MNEKQGNLSDEVIIEIVPAIICREIRRWWQAFFTLKNIRF